MRNKKEGCIEKISGWYRTSKNVQITLRALREMVFKLEVEEEKAFEESFLQQRGKKKDYRRKRTQLNRLKHISHELEHAMSNLNCTEDKLVQYLNDCTAAELLA